MAFQNLDENNLNCMNSIYCFNLIQDRCLIKIDFSLAQKVEHRYKKIFARYIFEYNIFF